MMNTILIIDDEPIIRKLLARMMELEGYEVFQAADRASGLKLLTAKTPQLVLCDVFLPDGNGVEMVKEIKELQPETEVILLTAHGNIPDGVQAIKNGAFDYITKGDDNNKIIPIISRAMEKINSRPVQPSGSTVVPVRESAFARFAASDTVGSQSGRDRRAGAAYGRDGDGKRGIRTGHS